MHASRKDIEYNEASLRELVIRIQDTSKETMVLQLDSLLEVVSADSTVFRKSINFVSEQVSDPNSPYRNDLSYTLLLNAQLNSKWYSQSEKRQVSTRLHLLQQNTPGSKANDFAYITPDGSMKRLFDINGKYILLFFYNPECGACLEMNSLLSLSAVINTHIKEEKLILVAIYTDKDQSIWRSHLPELPSSWIHGRDENGHLYKEHIYDLTAIPTIYLLDSNKKVLLKDCLSLEEIEHIIMK